MKMNHNQHLLTEPRRGLFSTYKVISSHLRKLNYPEKSIENIQKCGTKTGFFVTRYCECCSKQIKQTYRCSLRVCPECAKIRQNKIIAKYLPHLENLSKEKSPNRLFFLTISPKNYKEFKEGFDDIKIGLNKFLRLKYIKQRIKGGIYILESKYNPQTFWNIHIHMLYYGRQLDNKLRGRCKDCGQNYIKKREGVYFCASRKCNSLNVIFKPDSKIVDLFQKSAKRKVNIDIKRLSSPKTAIKYLTKYISANKDDFSDDLHLAQYIAFTRKKKLINTFGSFFKHKFTKTSYYCNKCGDLIQYYFLIIEEAHNIQDNIPDYPKQQTELSVT